MAPHQLEAGASLQVQLQVSDVDGDLPVFHASSLPAGASLSAAGLLSWPNAAPVGSYDIVYFASDGYSSSTPAMLSVTITRSMNTLSTVAPATSGGGGSIEADWCLAGAVLIAVCRRIRRRR
jgi:hypothetical protein